MGDELDFAISNFDHEQNRLPDEDLADAVFIQHLARLDSARLWGGNWTQPAS